MVGAGLLYYHSDFFPHLSGHAVGLGYRSGVRSLLLFPLQVQGQEPPAFLSHARLGGYVWLQLDVRSD